MKKLLSKVLALTLCTCTMVGLATSASAAEISPFFIRDALTNKKVEIVPVYASSHRLNMYTSSVTNLKDNTDVTTWNTKINDGTQYWIINSYNVSQETYTVRPYTQQSFVLNLYNNSAKNCSVYSEYGNDINDYVIKIVSEGPNADEYFGFVLPNRGLCMTLMNNEAMITYGNQKGYNVRWRAPIASSGVDSTQAWDVNSWGIYNYIAAVIAAI